MKFAAEITGVGLFAFIALLGAAFAVDNQFQQHMWVLFFTLVVFGVLLMRNTSFAAAAGPAAGTAADDSAYLEGPIRYGAIATIFWRFSSPSPTSISSPGSPSAACGRCTLRPSSSPSAAMR
jgi:cytochrome c oxidase cbb3-type subunit 1